MKEVDPDRNLKMYIDTFHRMGGALDYAFLEADADYSSDVLHKQAAIEGMQIIDGANSTCDLSKIQGSSISYQTFLGTVEVQPVRISQTAGSIPNVDGYKTAFFHPPYGLRETLPFASNLFVQINNFLFGSDPDMSEIFSWSTDWSNYFDAGREWWGAFYWTIRQPNSRQFVVIGASTTD
ncbi:MAG TPA: hypothetical protein VGJ04_11970 [Pirellulales bacterium]|jgi:hypothetical protein